MILDEVSLKLYASNGFNVILSGRPGVGKTEIIKSVFSSCFGADRWAYFSAATMDAWVDFVGVPKAITRPDGTEVIELIRPARFADDNVEAIFFDEFNRAPAKVRNAVMELIQFKSINGRKFNNLKVIWAAINPFDEEGTYDVEQLDPAQLDRFQIQIEVPYKIDAHYLKGKYGVLSSPFVEWWKSLSEDLKFKISPRRIEDGIRVHQIGGDLSHVYPKESNITDLNTRIAKISLDDEWKDIIKKSAEEQALFFQNVSKVEKFKDLLIKNFDKFGNNIPHDYLIGRFDTKQVDWLDAALNNIAVIPKAVVLEVEKTHNLAFEDALKALKGILPKNSQLDLRGKNVVITGTLNKTYNGKNLTRNDFNSFLTSIGANPQSKVTGTTDYLICTDPNSNTSKVVDARTKGIAIISEDEFHAAYGSN
jgi:hypothetical protein